MKLRLAMIAALTASAAAGQALAGSTCTQPRAPSALDGRTATLEQLMASKDAVLAFMDASDTYQTCVLGELESAKSAADLAKTDLPATVSDEAHGQVAANQAEKEKVGAEFNDAVHAYNTAHPH